jgi:hypothetical protein
MPQGGAVRIRDTGGGIPQMLSEGGSIFATEEDSVHSTGDRFVAGVVAACVSVLRAQLERLTETFSQCDCAQCASFSMS